MFRCLLTLKFSVIFFFLSSCVCLESPEPEVFLQPRNFNPHPYTEGGRNHPEVQAFRRVTTSSGGAQGRNGPVLFPPNLEDAERSNAVDGGHPYASVARKQKIKAGRFVDEQENSINPRVYSGLANYAAKVLKKTGTTSQANGYSDPSLSTHKKNYAFSYTVRDHATGDDFSHSQSQNSAATNGEYRVKLPDGRVQIVSYTADKNGYKADVKYAEEERRHYHQEVDSVHHRQEVPELFHDYDYYDEHPTHRGQLTQLELPIYVNPYQNHHNYKYQPEYVTIYPQKLPSQYLVEDKVQIYSGSVRGNSQIQQKVVQIGENIQSTPKGDKYANFGDSLSSLPYAHEPHDLSPVGVSVSTVSPPHYSQLYVSTPRYSVIHRSSHLSTPAPYYKRR